MKKFYLKICGIFLFTIFFFVSLLAYTPEKMTYQVVIRDQHNRLVSNQQIEMRISIVQWTDDGTAVYIETQRPTTNVNGLVSIEIGMGTVIAGNFSNIAWADGPYYIKTEIDLTGGQLYTVIGIQQLLSVPYALHSKSAESISGHIVETDPLFYMHVASLISSPDISYWNQKQNPMYAGRGIVIAGDTINAVFPTESDPLFITSAAAGIDTADITHWDQKQDALTAGSGISIANNTISTAPGNAIGEMHYWDGTNWVIVPPPEGNDYILAFFNGVPMWTTIYGALIIAPPPPLLDNEVYSPITRKIWLDKNLGASQVATSSTDTASYGDLYQWGRGRDGHEKRTSSLRATLSTGDTSGHGDFISSSFSPYDWRSPQNNNLWQGVDGINNPCPQGYRIPTEAEWNAERLSWGSNNSAGAFGSPLKLPVAGFRGRTGSFIYVDSYGYYWSSTVAGVYTRRLGFQNNDADMDSNNRAGGYSVRCLKD